MKAEHFLLWLTGSTEANKKTIQEEIPDTLNRADFTEEERTNAEIFDMVAQRQIPKPHYLWEIKACAAHKKKLELSNAKK